MSKRLALKNILTNMKSLSISNSDKSKRISVTYKDSKSSIAIPKELIPEEILKKKKGDFHFSISGNLGNVSDKAVEVKIKDYSCSLYEPDKQGVCCG